MYVHLKKADQLVRENQSELFSLKNRTIELIPTLTRRLTIPTLARKF